MAAEKKLVVVMDLHKDRRYQVIGAQGVPVVTPGFDTQEEAERWANENEKEA